MAANADGHIDALARTRISQQFDRVGLEHDVATFVQATLKHPIDARQLAAKADSAEAAAEMYPVSRLVIDTTNADEKRYLDKLVDALGLEPELVTQLEQQLRPA